MIRTCGICGLKIEGAAICCLGELSYLPPNPQLEWAAIHYSRAFNAWQVGFHRATREEAALDCNPNNALHVVRVSPGNVFLRRDTGEVSHPLNWA